MSAPLIDEAARARIATALDETLFVEAGAGSGKTRSLVDRVVALIESGIEMSAIATITFTEKAAAQLRDRISRALADRAADPTVDEDIRQRLTAALRQVDAAAISTLHAFAQRILTENPIEAKLPPNLEVLDEVASEIAFTDRWLRFRDALLDDPDLERWLLLAFAAGIKIDDIRHLATVFGGNWDLVAEPGRLPWERQAPPDLEIDGLLERIGALLERRSECTDDEDRLLRHLTAEIEPLVTRLREAPDDYEVLRQLMAAKPRFGFKQGRKENWVDKASVVDELDGIGEAKGELAGMVAQACLERLALEVADFTLEAARQRRTSGRLEFHDLLVLARELLRGDRGVEVRERLRRRYQRLLLDEFQDTDPIQIDLAVLIGSDDPEAAHKQWSDIPVEAGRLFFVGDPKQSIYRFRRADIDLFLRASEVFGAPVPLTTNFRTTPAVIDWVNHVFSRLIEHEAGSQPAYQPLAAAPTRTGPPDGHPVVVLGAEPHAADLRADDLRDAEAAEVAQTVLTALGWQVSERDGDEGERWRDARLGDITILLPARTSLAALEAALDQRDIPYRAETSSLVYSTREVRDLMATVRAVVDPTDQLALVTALRSAVFGCGDDDLFSYRVLHGGGWHVHAPTPEGLDEGHPVVAALRYLASLDAERPWLAPSELLDRIARDRRLFELAYAEGRPRDVWRRLRFVIDQARAWSEAEGGTLREYVEWARMQASESARVAETVLPETDDDSVRIMTIHGAKGLEFPITIVSGMTTASRGMPQRVEVTFPPDEPVAIKVGTQVVMPEFAKFKPIDEQMGFHERLRLLYVACTRAQDHLVVSLHRKQRNPPSERRNCTNAELVAAACDELDLVELDGSAASPPVAPETAAPQPPPAFEDWEDQLATALWASTWRRSVGASDVHLPASAIPDVDAEPGMHKRPRDLELPPWRKGRYGTSIGRAVHAVLQTIDLATGAGVTEAAAAQAAAEGVIGREADIARLVEAALEAPSVRAAAATVDRWRETYVATPVATPDGERTLEGYIDLLYRTDDGLVVVDYKTASEAADLDARLDAYRGQGGAYAVAVEGATGQRVARVVFVFLTADGWAERDLPDLGEAKRQVLAALARPPAASAASAASAGAALSGAP